jgi:hypothetical protein
MSLKDLVSDFRDNILGTVAGGVQQLTPVFSMGWVVGFEPTATGTTMHTRDEAGAIFLTSVCVFKGFPSD